MENRPQKLSQNLLFAVKTEAITQHFVDGLATLDVAKMKKSLSTDTDKKAFWINLYNAFFQILRKEHQLKAPAIYREKQIVVAGQSFSLDDIEHGILRRYRWKFSLGYLPNTFTPKYIKQLAVDKIDGRIHFALNCGAKSCPPIAFYTPEELNDELDLAAGSFLEGETTINAAKKEVHTTRLLLWFRADFGGKKGIRQLLEKHLAIALKNFSIQYNDYSWEEQLDNYID